MNLGATTIWERWNSLDENGHISSTGMNSLNHYTYGSITAWLFKAVAGLTICEDVPGYGVVEIKPLLNWSLRTVKMIYPSVFGTYEVEWKIQDLNHVYVRIVIPYKAVAKVTLPMTNQPVQVLTTGEYEYEYETIEPIAQIYSVTNHLQDLIVKPSLREALRKHIADVDYVASYAGEYPLSETLRNLGYTEEKINVIDGKLKEASIII